MLWSIERMGSLKTYIEFEFKGILAGELYVSGGWGVDGILGRGRIIG